MRKIEKKVSNSFKRKKSTDNPMLTILFPIVVNTNAHYEAHLLIYFNDRNQINGKRFLVRTE